MSAKEPGQRSFELWDEKVWRGRGERLLWFDLDGETKTFWAELEAAIEAPHLSEIAALRARVAKLESTKSTIAKLHERAEIIAKLGEAIELAGEMEGHADPQGAARRLWALGEYHASLSQGPPPDLPAPGRDRDMPRRPTVDRMEAEPERAEQDHAHEVGSGSVCDRSLRHGATPCLTWLEPEYGGRCRACGGTKEEHQGRT